VGVAIKCSLAVVLDPSSGACVGLKRNPPLES
jgi:hypothetical protein